MKYDEHMKRLGLNPEEIMHIEEIYIEYEEITCQQLEKIVAVLESKRSGLLALFTVPAILVIVALSLPNIIKLLEIGITYNLLMGILLTLYLVVSVYYILNQFNEYAHKMREIRLHLEICNIILARKLNENRNL